MGSGTFAACRNGTRVVIFSIVRYRLSATRSGVQAQVASYVSIFACFNISISKTAQIRIRFTEHFRFSFLGVSDCGTYNVSEEDGWTNYAAC